MITEAGPRPSFRPAHWPGWLLVGLIWTLGRLPRGLALALSGPLGWLMRVLMSRRRAVARRNIERCFPGQDHRDQQALLAGSFQSLARSVFEIAWSWTWPDRRFDRLGQVEGAGPVAALLESGRGVLMVTAHLTCLEVGGRLLAREFRAAGIYRPLRNAPLEWFQNRARLRYGEAMISKRALRDAVRYLRGGGLVWYAPDQDFGREQSLFVPFFGVSTATLLATHRLAKLTGCAVVPMFPAYDESTRTYTVRILPELEGFADEAPAAALARLNGILEAHVRSWPRQYWWIHRRFKTRPEGEAPFYG